MFENLLLAREDAVALVTIHRPQVLNALNTSTLDELRDLAATLAQDRSVRVVIVTGAGEKAFAAGADINELVDQDPARLREYSARGQEAFDRIEHLGKPVIAAINGFALGGGCELAMACTLRLAADTARLGQPEITLGTIPGFAGTQRLARLIGKPAALDLLLTGRHVAADEAWRLGLVNRVVPAAELMPAARALAGELSAKPPVAVSYILDAVHRGLDGPFEAGERLESALFGLVASTGDMREGTRAFLEKRKPTFTGE